MAVLGRRRHRAGEGGESRKERQARQLGDVQGPRAHADVLGGERVAAVGLDRPARGRVVPAARDDLGAGDDPAVVALLGELVDVLHRHPERPLQLGIALEVDGRSRAAGADKLWALGPLTKGRYWEIIAVPDIREQAAAVAEDIQRELGR